MLYLSGTYCMHAWNDGDEEDRIVETMKVLKGRSETDDD